MIGVQPVRAAPHQPRKLAYIDALRGYAVLLVIMSHVGNAFPLLPYPFARLMDFGVGRRLAAAAQ